MSAELIYLLTEPLDPVPAAVRTRRWVEGDGVLTYGDIRLQLVIGTDAITGASWPSWRVQMGANPEVSALTFQPLRLDYSHQVHVIPRAVRYSPAGVCLGVLLELRAARIDRLPVLCEVSYG